MLELNREFPVYYNEGFTELDFYLDLVRKYPVHKPERKLWRKLNRRSSLQFTGSIVEDANCQEDTDQSYKVYMRM